MLLNEEQKATFVEWLTSEIASDKEILKQAEIYASTRAKSPMDLIVREKHKDLFAKERLLNQMLTTEKL